MNASGSPSADLLANRTLELVDIPSVSRDEQLIAERVRGAIPAEFSLEYDDDGCLFYRSRPTEAPLVVLAGHLDTVPAQDNLPGRIEDGSVVGLGASDMKGGLAVMIELARWVADERPQGTVDLGLLFFGREELPAAESPLPRFFERVPRLGGAELAVMLEPTDCTLQVGCLGNLNARLTFRGESAHSARPWLGVNAIDRALRGLVPLVEREPEEVSVGGLVFKEVLSLTRIEAGITKNVIPDRAEALLNFRYAPDRTPAEAEARLRELVGGAGELSIESNSPPAPVPSGSALLDRLRQAGGLAVEPKQAWTPIAEFAAQGVDAVNLGPGATHYAHRRDERVEIEGLVRTFEALQRFVGGSV